jgi:hypothetical protein
LVSGAGAEYANIGRYDPSQTSSPFLKCSRRFIPSHAWHSAARALSNHSPDKDPDLLKRELSPELGRQAVKVR